MNDDQDFYRAFEDKYRGSRQSIKDRLEVYRSFVGPLLEIGSVKRAIDLGCGRGEWIELMGEAGFEAIGVDLDVGMLAAAKQNGLNVELADVIQYLEQQPEASAAVVSGFHIAEHLPFDVLQHLVRQAHRVLMPGGLLILETPNPENVTVGASSFYLDPTHERPIPPELLSFLPEYYGFDRNCILRLQEPEWVRKDGAELRLLDVFEGVSPDYAVVAQKAGCEQSTALLDDAFKLQYGVNLASLAGRYQWQNDRELARNAEQVRHNAVAVERAIAEAEQAVLKAEQAALKAEQATSRAEQAVAKAEDLGNIARSAQTELASLYNSRSWRITQPLRWVAFQVSLLRQLGPSSRGKALVRKLLSPVLSFLVVFIGARPRLRHFCVNTAQKVGLYSRLRNLYHGGRFFQNVGSQGSAFYQSRSASESLEEMTPDARRTYYKLRTAIDEKRKQT